MHGNARNITEYYGVERGGNFPTSIESAAARQILAHGEEAMDWEKLRTHVDSQISYWRALGKHDWADALEECLAKAERCQAIQEVIVDLRQRLEPAE